MRKIFLIITTLFTGFYSLAADENPLVISAGHVRNIELGSDMKVTFITAVSYQKNFKSDVTDAFDKLNIIVSEGKMRIELRKKTDNNQRVYIVVEGLQSLIVNENTVVNSESEIPGKEIKINIADNSSVRLTTAAAVKAQGFDGIPVDVATRQLSPKKDLTSL